jgi:hypothetical protein
MRLAEKLDWKGLKYCDSDQNCLPLLQCKRSWYRALEILSFQQVQTGLQSDSPVESLSMR